MKKNALKLLSLQIRVAKNFSVLGLVTLFIAKPADDFDPCFCG